MGIEFVIRKIINMINNPTITLNLLGVIVIFTMLKSMVNKDFDDKVFKKIGYIHNSRYESKSDSVYGKMDNNITDLYDYYLTKLRTHNDSYKISNFSNLMKQQDNLINNEFDNILNEIKIKINRDLTDEEISDLNKLLKIDINKICYENSRELFINSKKIFIYGYSLFLAIYIVSFFNIIVYYIIYLGNLIFKKDWNNININILGMVIISFISIILVILIIKYLKLIWNQEEISKKEDLKNE